MEEDRARKCCGGRGGCVTKCWRRLWTSRFASSLGGRKGGGGGRREEGGRGGGGGEEGEEEREERKGEEREEEEEGKKRRLERRKGDKQKTIRWHVVSSTLCLTLVRTGGVAGEHFLSSHLPRTSGRRAARGRD